jgi:nitrate reductase NapE component
VLALWIILAVIVLLLLLPVGVEAAFIAGELSLSVKAGVVKIKILPAKPKNKEGKKKPREKKKDGEKKEKKPKKKLTLQEILDIAKLGLKALSRFRRRLSIDVLMVHLCVATKDPYDTVKQYGTINAAIGALLPQVHRAFKIKDEDIATAMDFTGEKMSVDARFVATVQIWEILYISICAGAGFLVWLLRHKKRIKALKVKDTVENNGEKGC